MSGKSMGPRPGSVTDRVIRHLRDMGIGADVTCEDVANLTGVKAHLVHSLLSHAVAQTWLIRVKNGQGRAVFLLPSTMDVELADAKARSVQDSDPFGFEVDEAPIVQRWVCAGSAPGLFRPWMVASVFHVAGAQA